MLMKLYTLKKEKKYKKLIMKIKSIIHHKQKNKLIELQILKSKMYKIYLEKKKIETNKINLQFKKIAHIIYEYHINNKTILFINFPPKFEKNLLLFKKSIKHIFLSKENWINGFLNNKFVDINFNKVKSNIKKKNNFFDLIVIFNPKDNIMSEKYNSSIPTIIVTDEVFKHNNSPLFKQSYKILGYFKFLEEQINNNFFFSIIQSIIKKKRIQNHTINANFKLAIKKKKFKKYMYKNARYKKKF